MSVTINIGGVDKTNKVEYNSVRLNRALTSQVDTLNFTVIKNPASNYKPTILDTVEIIEDGETIFGGQIVEINEGIEGKDIEIIDCICKDYSYEMDRSMVIASYSNVSVTSIITDIKNNYLPSGYDITNAVCPFIVSHVSFNYEYPSKCFQQLAELTGYDWYVDVDKKIYFFTKDTNPAPFDLTDVNDKYYYNSLKLHRDLKNIRNTVIVRGGEYKGSLSSEKVIADGTALIYKQGLQYSSIFVKVNTVTKTVGIDNIDDPAGFDCLYNFQEKFIRFKTATVPTNGHVVEVGGLPHIPVIVKVKDPVSIAQYGVYEYKIIDKSIATKEGARDRAKAEIYAWASQLNDGTFETNVAGLDVGQKIKVSSTIRGITDEYYIISKITSSLSLNGTEFLHKITLVTSQAYGMIEFLQKLLISKDKEIEIKEGEVLDEVESILETITFSEVVTVSKVHNTQTETITVSESATVQALNYPVEFCAGDFAPTGYKRVFVLDGSPLG